MAHNHGSNESNRLEKLEKNRKKLTFVLILILLFAGVEVVGGLLSNSLALISDAGHMVLDAVAIGLSLFAVHLSLKPSTARNTYSFGRMEIVAAFINGITLMALAGYIVFEAIQRFQEPPVINGGMMLVVATLGMIINIISAMILWGSAHENLNIKGAMFHILGDLAGSVGAVIAAIVIIYTGWTIVDPAVSILIGILIIRSSWVLLKESLHVLMEGAPKGYDSVEITAKIKEVEGVVNVHDFHLWSITTGVVLLTAHVQISSQVSGVKTLQTIVEMLEKEYGLTHSTIQIEDPAMTDCPICC